MRPESMTRIGLRPIWISTGLLMLFLMAAMVSIDCEGHRSRPVAAKAQIAAFHAALERYRLDVGDYPTVEQGLKALQVDPGARGWHGPYLLHDVPNDPWGHPYVYRFPGRHGERPDIISLGADGQPGGEGTNADIVSWKN